jgi:hypothetical protein
VTVVAGPVAWAVRVPSLVGQSVPKNGMPSMTFAAGAAATYWSIAVFSLNMELVSGDVADVGD